MPCYDEESVVAVTVERLFSAFEAAGRPLELVAVDNGSEDRTGEILRGLASAHPGLRVCRVEVNEGYGWGVLVGLRHCTAEWVGVVPADGQVDAEDVVRLYEAALGAGDDVLAKARRRFRMDGIRRKVVSVTYNLLMQLLWPGLGSFDVNGLPKILRRRTAEAMDLRSRDWLLDPEIMIKAHRMDLRVLEMNVFARMRGGGASNVGALTSLEFLVGLLRFRLVPGALGPTRRVVEADDGAGVGGSEPVPADPASSSPDR